MHKAKITMGGRLLSFLSTGMLILVISITFSLAGRPIQRVMAAGTTYYVSPTGNDANAGTSTTSAWKTLAPAAQKTVAGDTVLIATGSYPAVNLTRSGTASAQITYKANGSGAVVAGFLFKGANYTTITGLEITGSGILIDVANGGGSYDQIISNNIHDVWANDGISVRPSSWTTSPNTPNVTHDIFRNNHISRVLNSGMLIMGQSHLIEGNTISDVFDHAPGGATIDDANGIRFFGTNHIFRNNVINITHAGDNGDPHLDCFQTWHTANHILFEGNFCHNPDTTLSNQIVMIENQDGDEAISNLTFRNNVFVMDDEGYTPMNINRKSGNGSISHIYIYNNTFAHHGSKIGSYAIRILGTGGPINDVVIKNNLFLNWGDSSNGYLNKSTNVAASVGNNAVYNSMLTPLNLKYAGDLWMVDPKVVSLQNLDLHLQSSSPLINAGTAYADPLYGALTVDYDQKARTGTMDIGAYESSTSGTAPTATAATTATAAPTKAPTSAPTTAPTTAPTAAPTKAPTSAPTAAPTKAPTSAPTSAPTLAPTSMAGPNLILNPGYESGTTSWVFWTAGKGSFTASTPVYTGAKAARVAITTATTGQTYIKQAGITLVAGKKYTLTFMAKSTSGHDLDLTMLKNVSPYTVYGPNHTVFPVTTAWQKYTVQFTAANFSGTVSDARLIFSLEKYATAGDVYSIDDVTLTPVN
jgi:hypothetical protein